MLNDFEIQGNSLERIRGYIDIEQEPKPTAAGIPPAYWPASGKLSVERLSAKYSTDGPKVLHDVSFEIQSGERVGVGKLELKLFRIDANPAGHQLDAPDLERVP